MTNYLVIGTGAGIASAVLFFAAGNLSVLSFALFLAAPLPLFIAGLGWGHDGRLWSAGLQAPR